MDNVKAVQLKYKQHTDRLRSSVVYIFRRSPAEALEGFLDNINFEYDNGYVSTIHMVLFGGKTARSSRYEKWEHNVFQSIH